MKTKTTQETITEFREEISNSDFWLNPKNYPKNYKKVINFLEVYKKQIITETEKKCEEDYQVFIKEMHEERRKALTSALSQQQERMEKIIEGMKKEERITVNRLGNTYKTKSEKNTNYNQALQDIIKAIRKGR